MRMAPNLLSPIARIIIISAGPSSTQFVCDIVRANHNNFADKIRKQIGHKREWDRKRAMRINVVLPLLRRTYCEKCQNCNQQRDRPRTICVIVSYSVGKAWNVVIVWYEIDWGNVRSHIKQQRQWECRPVVRRKSDFCFRRSIFCSVCYFRLATRFPLCGWINRHRWAQSVDCVYVYVA